MNTSKQDIPNTTATASGGTSPCLTCQHGMVCDYKRPINMCMKIRMELDFAQVRECNQYEEAFRHLRQQTLLPTDAPKPPPTPFPPNTQER